MKRVLGSAALVVLLGGAACRAAPPAAPARSTAACAASMAEWCAGSGDSRWCSWSLYADPTQFDCARTSLAMCGPYDVALAMSGGDVGTVSYYDAATGRLAAVVGYSANGPGARTCLAGPGGGFAEPDCPAANFTSSCPGGHPCAPNGASCVANADCCSAGCAPRPQGGECCPPSGCR